MEPLRAPGETSSIPAAGRFSKQIKRLLGAFQATRPVELYRNARSSALGSVATHTHLNRHAHFGASLKWVT